jgi:hypothetical protein
METAEQIYYLLNKDSATSQQYVGFTYTKLNGVYGYLGIDNNEVVFIYADERGVVKDVLDNYEITYQPLSSNEQTESAEKKLPPLIQKLADAIEQKGLKVQFGLEQQGHIPTIEKMLAEFGSARSEYIWKKIGKAIGWEYTTAAFYYIEYLRRK